MFCEKCGAQVADDALFCPACGNAVRSSEPEDITSIPKQEGVIGSGTNRKVTWLQRESDGVKNQVWVIMVAVAVAVMAAIVIVGNSQSKAGFAPSSSASSSTQAASEGITKSKPTKATETSKISSNDQSVYDPIIKAYQDFQASGFKVYSPSIIKAFLVRYKDSDGSTAGGGIYNISQAMFVYSLQDINGDGTPELFVGVKEADSTAASFFDVYTAVGGQVYFLLSPIDNQYSLSLLTDGTLEWSGGRMGSYYDCAYVLSPKATSLTPKYEAYIQQDDPEGPITFEKGTLPDPSSLDGFVGKQISLAEYEKLTDRPAPTKAEDLLSWALKDNRLGIKAVNLQWTDMSSWKFADGSTAQQETGTQNNQETDNGVTQQQGEALSGEALSDAQWHGEQADDYFPASGFYGVWIAAKKTRTEALDPYYKMYGKNLVGGIITTSKWSNLNPEPWYAICVGPFGTKQEAENALAQAKAAGYSSAYIKYSGAKK